MGGLWQTGPRPHPEDGFRQPLGSICRNPPNIGKNKGTKHVCSCMKAWAKSLGGISFPLLSDFTPFAAVSRKYGIKRKEGYSERAIFVVDGKGIIRYIDIPEIGDQPENRVLFAEFKRIVEKKPRR